MELLYAQGMLDNAQGREIRSPALKELLLKLQQLSYGADDVLDELEYFRIQDELDGTYNAADEHAGGCLHNQALNARHAAKGIGKMLGFSSRSRSASRGDRDKPDEETRGVLCGAWPCRGNTTPSKEQEEGASRGVSCGVAWPCCGQPTHQIVESSPPPTNQADQEEVHTGCMQKLASGARNTINIVGKHLPCYSVSSPVKDDASSNVVSSSSGRQFLCCSRPNKLRQREHSVIAPKLKFNRVEMSTKMKEITEQLKPVCAKVSTILNLELLDSNRSIAQCISTSLDTMLSKKQGLTPLLTNSAASSRPITTAELIEPKIYGREDAANKIIYEITKGDYYEKDLTVLPIVGPGGIGKTTLSQYIYKELQHQFEENIWVCVSTTFSVYRLTQEIAENLKVDKYGNLKQLFEERLKSKKFLLVLDDMWSCSDDEWRRFLVPLTKGQTKGNTILVTTRFPALAQMVKTTNNWIDLQGLDTKAFKELFLAYVFGDKESSDDHSGLLDVGFRIMEKLKGSPLAAKTVGRLLRKHLDLDHWNKVLESKEWESENGEHDIMPALKLSYDYLPFHLQQCFSYCALFPEDYRFKTEELIHLWIGVDVLHSHGKNKRTEDIGLDHLIELVSYGFFRKEDGKSVSYVIHDLLHELALKVSSHECLSIYSHNVRSIQIPPSIRHLSVSIDDASVKDRMAFDSCRKDLSTVHKRLKVENLRSLMLFGEYHGSFVKDFAHLFKEAKALRVVFLSRASYNVEGLLHNFSNCVHLRYLRIRTDFHRTTLPNIISRFYHLRVLDLQESYKLDCSTKDMSNLVKLCHFLVPNEAMHSEIFEAGKLKSLQELRRFEVKKESQGFGLNQIGHLVQLCGSLSIYNLEKVESNEEADEAELIQKPHLRKLALHWDSARSNKESAREELVLESLKPNSNLAELCINGNGGTACPTWLGANLSVKNLEFLQLENVSWKNLPPLGELWLVDGHGKESQSCILGQNFNNLKRLELVKIQKLKKWIGNGPCELFSHLEVLVIEDCPELTELPFTHHTGCEPKHEDHMAWFPKLGELQIKGCPQLSSLPCIPWSTGTISAKAENVSSSFERLCYIKDYYVSGDYSLEIKGKDALDRNFWMVVAFHNLSHLRRLNVTRCPPLSLEHLQMLSSLKTLQIHDSGNAVFLPEGDGCVLGSQFPVENIKIERWGGSGERLTRLLSCFPKLLKFTVSECEKLTGLGVVNHQQKTEAPTQQLSSSSINEVEAALIIRQQGATIAAAASEELLLLPLQLQELWIEDCPNLVLCTDSLDSNRDAEPPNMGGRGGLQAQRSLRSLTIYDCPRFLSSYSSSSSSPPCFPFPTSLEHLTLGGVEGMETLLPLSNLTSLTELYISNCGDLLRGEGLRPLLAQGRLTQLTVWGTPNFFAGPEPLLPHEQESPSSSSKLQRLETDDVAGALAAPIWTLLSSSLTDLVFCGDKEVERFTKGQDEALQLLTSLEKIKFGDCKKLQCIPAGLHRLPNLKRLYIRSCEAIRSLPKDGLPSSLQELEIDSCPAMRSIPKECLPNSLQKLVIEDCPAIRSLPKAEDLPSSLRELNVRYGNNNEELRRQCRKLIGTIPIVRA